MEGVSGLGPLLEKLEETNGVADPLFHKKCPENVRLTANINQSYPADDQVDSVLEKKDNSDYLKLESAYKDLEIEKFLLEIEKKPREKEVFLENERVRLLEENKKLENENRQLAQVNQMQVLEIEKITKEKEKLLRYRNYLDLVEEEIEWKEMEQEQNVSGRATGVSNFERFRMEVKTWMIIAQIQMTSLENWDHFKKKFGRELKWGELSPTVQKFLLGKVQMNGRPFMNFDKILPINSKALIRMIKAGENDETLLETLIEDYYQGKKQLYGKVCWDNLDDTLLVYLTSKLSESSLESLELKLDQVPLSSGILVHLIKDKTEDPAFLGNMVTSYVDEMVNGSSSLMNDLCKVALLEQINSLIIGFLEVHFLDPEALDGLVEYGMLRKTESEFGASYGFSHDSVRHWIIGVIMRKLMEQVKISRMNAFMLFYGGYSNLSAYFADYVSELEQSHLANINFDEISDKTLASLIMALSVMRLPSLEAVIAILNHSKSDVRDIVLSRRIPESEDLTFTLPHAAAIRGDLERMNCLLNEFGFSEELTCRWFRGVMWACLENTKGCRDEQIQERKEIIYKLLLLNLDSTDCDPVTVKAQESILNVHPDLVKYLTELETDSWHLRW